jgi:hypothetical protein
MHVKTNEIPSRKPKPQEWKIVLTLHSHAHHILFSIRRLRLITVIMEAVPRFLGEIIQWWGVRTQLIWSRVFARAELFASFCRIVD